MLDLKKIKQAQKRVSKVVQKTPFSYSPILSELSDCEVFLKKENLQHTGSFKLRGAFNKISILSENGDFKTIITASAGNHAQGVAYASNHFNIPSIVVMPLLTPLVKVEGVKKYSVEVVLYGESYEDSYEYAKNLARENDYNFVHPFEDEDIMAGQGTVALEMFEEEPDLDVLIVPVGGGGLISGVQAVVKEINPNCKVIGVGSTDSSSMKASYDNKEVTSIETKKTIADGIAVKRTSPVILEYILNGVENFEEVEDDEIASAILFLLENQKISVEGAGAVGVAALIHKKLDIPAGSKVGVIISGGNIDVTMLSLIIEKGLVKSGKKMKLVVTLEDRPGALQQLTNVFVTDGANIVQIGYDRTSTALGFGSANVSVSLETKSYAQQTQIRRSLEIGGFEFKEEY